MIRACRHFRRFPSLAETLRRPTLSVVRFSAIFEQCDLEYADFLVYDRWGELIFQGYEPTEQWDGLTLNGTEAMSDVYVYVLHYKRRDQSQEQFEKGQVTLLR